MSISLPNSKAEKKARYRMLVKQDSLTIQQARQEYKRYLVWMPKACYAKGVLK